MHFEGTAGRTSWWLGSGVGFKEKKDIKMTPESRLKKLGDGVPFSDLENYGRGAGLGRNASVRFWPCEAQRPGVGVEEAVAYVSPELRGAVRPEKQALVGIGHGRPSRPRAEGREHGPVAPKTLSRLGGTRDPQRRFGQRQKQNRESAVLREPGEKGQGSS